MAREMHDRLLKSYSALQQLSTEYASMKLTNPVPTVEMLNLQRVIGDAWIRATASLLLAEVGEVCLSDLSERADESPFLNRRTLFIRARKILPDWARSLELDSELRIGWRGVANRRYYYKATQFSERIVRVRCTGCRSDGFKDLASGLTWCDHCDTTNRPPVHA